MKTRSQIKHHEWRIKQKIRRWLKWSWQDNAGDSRWFGLKFHTPCLCSCPMCGNERKHFKQKTVKEKSTDEMFKLETRNNEKE